MVKLTDFNRKKTTRELVDSRVTQEHPREYLGMSGIGHSCERLLWYGFRWCYTPSFSARVIRLFNRGHREEEVVIEQLEYIGIKVSGEQKPVSGGFGFFGGHCDGIAENVPEAPKTPHLLEIKTMSDKYFKEITKKGTKVSKPIYYAQVQIYMKYYKLKRALFIAVNKNDDSWYVERIAFDSSYADMLDRKAETIIFATSPPTTKFSKSWYECKWCDAFDICHNNAPLNINCRTCKFIDMQNGGEWTCNYNNEPELLTVKRQRVGCTEYEILPI